MENRLIYDFVFFGRSKCVCATRRCLASKMKTTKIHLCARAFLCLPILAVIERRKKKQKQQQRDGLSDDG